ncbi:protein transporter tim10 [Coccomyxa viridis]|uniref:Mitochondrial import inner membrane translocase subunit n=1 Tax=Coccomyxa viridis TaxID=1274662 RepID=A0AAV1HV15_9CHLO|nr:protein transporter tim10 [Coccomyxa viridis]
MAASPEEVAKGVKMAEQEMDYRVDLFNRMVATCFDKCMDKRYKEGDLNVGENSCVDRCASKYWQVTGIVGQLLGGGQ